MSPLEADSAPFDTILTVAPRLWCVNMAYTNEQFFGTLTLMGAEIVVAEPRAPLSDENGLTLVQRQFLTLRAGSLTDYDTLNHMDQTSVWLATQMRDPAFRTAYNQLYPFDPKAVTRDALKILLPKVVGLLDAALESGDTKRQQWAVERFLKVSGLEKITIESTSTNIPADLLIAKQWVERGIAIPAPLAERLRAQGLLPEE